MKKKEKIKISSRQKNVGLLSRSFRNKQIIKSGELSNIEEPDDEGGRSTTACDLGEHTGENLGPNTPLVADWMPYFDTGPGISPCDVWLA